MKSIDIVVSVWNPPGLTFYSDLMRLQAASIASHLPDMAVRYVVYCNESDFATMKAAADVMANRNDRLRVDVLLVSPAKLFRRAIARNHACLSTAADVIWLTDCDYSPLEGCLDDMHASTSGSGSLCYPSSYWISRTHEIGEATISRVRRESEPAVRIDDYKLRGATPCIGGLFCLDGDVARRHGYLNGTEWVEPVDPSLGFRSSSCDVKARTYYNRLRIPRTKINVRNLYRTRHLTDGRDFSVSGDFLGKSCW